MAAYLRIIREDDLDKTPGASPLAFAWDGQEYEIDLSPEHREEFERRIAPYIRAARPVKQTRDHDGIHPEAPPQAEVRKWLRELDVPVCPSGPLPGHLLTAFRSALAHAQGVQPGAGSSEGPNLPVISEEDWQEAYRCNLSRVAEVNLRTVVDAGGRFPGEPDASTMASLRGLERRGCMKDGEVTGVGMAYLELLDMPYRW